MQWIIFSILAMFVVSGVRKMAREEKSATAPFSAATSTHAPSPAIAVQDTVQCAKCGAFMVKNATCANPSCTGGNA